MNPFVAEIRIFPFNFAPTGWAFCNGQLMPISQNTALFSLLGTTYGGDGRTTFALPNLQGCAPIHPGQGPGLSLHDLGESAGVTDVTLQESQVPSVTHGHTLQAVTADGDSFSPADCVLAGSVNTPRYAGLSPDTPLAAGTLEPVTLGNDQPHNNMMPYLTLNFCIAMQGVYPARS